MLSRVADSIYWLNRYIERAENVARFVDVNLNLMLVLPEGINQQWEPLVTTTGDMNLFQERYGTGTAENVIKFLTFDERYPNSIVSCLHSARENARSVREIISSEMWQEVNNFYHLVTDRAKATSSLNMIDFFTEVKLASHRFAGVMDATMSHNEGWHFGQMGRLIERADKTTRILDVKYFYLLPSVEWIGTPLDQIQWIALLKSASGYEMYRKYQHRILPNSVAEFLILNREFPRSIYFSLYQAQQSLHQITNTPVGTWSNGAERTLGRICSELGYVAMSDVIQKGLHQFLDEMQASINNLDHQIKETFFKVYDV